MGKKTEQAKRGKECYSVGARVGLTEKVKSKQRVEGRGVSHVNI